MEGAEGDTACPEIRQSAPISALIKAIGLCGTQNAQKKIQTRLTNYGAVGGRNCWSGPRYFLCVLVTTEPNWVISTEIGALCHIPGHADVTLMSALCN